ncbi:MAG: biotin carboxylase N-terminal domain-containing protein [Pseudomonadota bacterium]
MTIKRILIANRGEIACRIIRTVQKTGREAIAVYSTADAHAAHRQLADRAIAIGEAPASQSYLSIDAVIGAAKRTGADAVHPGYGFLSENAAFADACVEAGLIFVGPPASAIALMGDKASAKRHMLERGVPCVPGYQGNAQDDNSLIAAANEIGLPVMIKAAAGGGGRGMRVVQDQAALPAALALARSEALSAFGSDVLIIERAIHAPRHVEVQIFADAHDNIIHLGERDCSMQRRHQKIIEEAPCPVVDDGLRERMGTAAIQAASAIGYRGAGTVEFLLDGEGEFYFLEMNTRLQVEHPVTELITGLDLVDLQIRVAEGEPLPLAQADVQLRGHAMEARLYAEDPARDFLPQSGDVAYFKPADAALARTDAGVRSGDTISPFYDPMLAKIIAHGSTRDEARRKLIRALECTALLGVVSNRDFLVDALRTPVFSAGETTTAFVDSEMSGAIAPALTDTDIAIAATVWFAHEQGLALAASTHVATELLGWSSDASLSSTFSFLRDDNLHSVVITPSAARRCTVRIGEAGIDTEIIHVDRQHADLIVADSRVCVDFALSANRLWFATRDRTIGLALPDSTPVSEDDEQAERLRAPMHGKVCSVDVTVGQQVAKGDRLAVIEAMKMQHEIHARRDVLVSAIHVNVDQQISADQLMIEFDTASA